MQALDRRRFLQQSTQAGLGLAAAGTFLSTARSALAVSANEKLVIAAIGLKGRGSVLAPDFAARPDCEVAYIADVDTQWFAPRGQVVESAQGKAPKAVQDFRRALDDKSVDAVVIATPDHWHALATIWACQAGKHVYVEKPASHSPWEGRKMVEAARKYDRVVQLGTQNRSASYNKSAKQYIDSGKLGKIQLVRVYNQKGWGNVPAVPNSDSPATLDYDMWTGPAPQSAYNTVEHGTWNHFWKFSGGDIINDGVHQMDLARWMIGKDYPKSVYAVGGRYEPGALDTPDTQVATYDYGDMLLTFELTLNTPYMIKSDAELRNSDDFPHWPQNAERIEIYGTEGLMVLGRHGCGWQVFGRPHQRKPVVVASDNGPFPDPEHKQDFCDAIREHRRPSADIEEGHKSTLLCQYANISYRLGGEKLVIDAATEKCIDNERANGLLKREYRAPYVVPEQV